MPALSAFIRARIDPGAAAQKRLDEWLASLPPLERSRVIRVFVADHDGRPVAMVSYSLCRFVRRWRLTPHLVAVTGREIPAPEWEALCQQADTGAPLTPEEAAAIVAAMPILPPRWSWPEQPYRDGVLFIRQRSSHRTVTAPLAELLAHDASRLRVLPPRRGKNSKPRNNHGRRIDARRPR
jgi:hypothetical protein